MNSEPGTRPACASARSHELHFVSLHNPGREVVFPCDEIGQVDLDALSDRLRTSYLGARAMVGREYSYPTVRSAH
jgi:hypothetical protein